MLCGYAYLFLRIKIALNPANKSPTPFRFRGYLHLYSHEGTSSLLRPSYRSESWIARKSWRSTYSEGTDAREPFSCERIGRVENQSHPLPAYRWLMNSYHCLLLVVPARLIDRQYHSTRKARARIEAGGRNGAMSPRNIIICAHCIGVRMECVRPLPIVDNVDVSGIFGIVGREKSGQTGDRTRVSPYLVRA